MTSYIRNPLTVVWAIATSITVVSWLISRGGGAAHVLSVSVTIGVLVIAAVKTQLVISYFMEVRDAPVWLRLTTTGWLVALFALLLGVYFAAL